MRRTQQVLALTLALGAALLVGGTTRAQEEGAPAAPAAAPQTPRMAAPFDPTGYWVAIISEDWRWRMITPAKGDFPSIPMNLDAQRVAEAWDPAKDEKAGEACKAYGAPGLIRGPVRMHITWQDDQTLKVDAPRQARTQPRQPSGAPQQPARPGA